MLRRLYLDWILGRPWIFVLLFLVVGGWFAWHVPDFKVEAGTSSLILEGDDSKVVYDETREFFTSDDYVLVAVQPRDPWSPEGLDLVTRLTEELRSLEGIESVLSPVNAPLLGQFNLFKLSRPPVLGDKDVDLALAREELSKWPLYSKQLMSEDGNVFNLVAYFDSADPEEIRREFRRLDREVAASDSPSEELIRARDVAKKTLLAAKDADRALQRAVVGRVRGILPKYRDEGAIVHASGLPTLSVDMVDYLNHDILVFGIAVALFLLVTLAVLFRCPRFVALPLLTCLLTVTSVMGLMVVTEVETTIVTSNITSLLFIIGMAHSIHLVVKYREERALFPDRPYRETLWEAVHAILEPCLYTALTTAVGFGSLYITDISVVKDFAVFMAVGVMLAFTISLVFLPACLALLPPTKEDRTKATVERQNPVLAALAGLALRRRPLVYVACVVLAAAAGWGISTIRVDQRFIDYFRSDTEVYQGLEFVDRVGGTMTVEVILHGDRPDYWVEEENLARVAAIHEWFEKRPQVGKTLSLVSLQRHGVQFLKKQMPFAAGMKFRMLVKTARDRFPKEELDGVLRAVATPDLSVTRVYVRLRESAEDLDRIGVLDELREFLRTDERLAAEWEKPANMQPQVTGMFVLFTNMLDTLVSSQVRSFGWVFAAVALMLVLLFRNLGAGLLAMPPNILPIAMVLGTMGFAAITLDVMTLMIASISLGIAVDASIHYVVRFRRELRRTGDWEQSIPRSHQSIGKAILYTALTVFVGFFVLVLSKFTPTMYFGVLTGVAMVAGLLANLIVLPSLLATFRPFRSEAGTAAGPGADDES